MEIDNQEIKQALTPPTSEGTGKKEDDDDDSGSELSELEPEEPIADPEPGQNIKEEEDDNQDEIVPDHYYEGGKIPVFKPVCIHLRHSRCTIIHNRVADLFLDNETVPEFQRIHTKD